MHGETVKFINSIFTYNLQNKEQTIQYWHTGFIIKPVSFTFMVVKVAMGQIFFPQVILLYTVSTIPPTLQTNSII